MAMLVTKADGESEAYDPQKLLQSLLRSGADPEVAKQIGAEIEKELRNGITTHEIYARAFALLREHRHDAAARYSLKRAVMDFGPSGFPFEAYIAELLRAEGWTCKIDQIIRGGCVEHEVDVVATKAKELLYVEAKFHNASGFKTDLKTTLYVKARLEDIGKGRGLIVTNTKFTSQAQRYAACAGIELLSWEEPLGATLHDRIEQAKLFPITALTTLSRREKMLLMNQKITLCRAIPEDTRALSAAGISGARADAVMAEAGALCLPPGGVQ
jgi:Restriction endonuclease/ATP cone domain